MSSGRVAEGGAQVAVAAEVDAGLAAKGDDLSAVEAVGTAGAGAAGAAFSRAGARAPAAVEAAAAVGHGRLPADAAAGPGLCPAARCLQIVSRRVAVPQSAAIYEGIGRSWGWRRYVSLDHGLLGQLNKT